MASTDWNALFDALTSAYRRRLLVNLLDRNPQTDGVIVPEDVHVGDTDLASLQVELYHHHLPKLEDSGYIDWNREDHEVVKGPRFDEIRPILELVHAHRDEFPDGWI